METLKKKQQPATTHSTPAPSPNTGLELPENYTNLEGKAFTDYQDTLGELLLNEKYDFEEWNAIILPKFRLNEDTGDKEEYINGVQLMGAKPVMTTRITLKQAIELNRFATTRKDDRNSKYYLLKKV